jgi:hypothetical protein
VLKLSNRFFGALAGARFFWTIAMAARTTAVVSFAIFFIFDSAAGSRPSLFRQYKRVSTQGFGSRRQGGDHHDPYRLTATDAATPRAAVGNGATPRAAHTAVPERASVILWGPSKLLVIVARPQLSRGQFRKAILSSMCSIRRTSSLPSASTRFLRVPSCRHGRRRSGRRLRYDRAACTAA